MHAEKIGIVERDLKRMLYHDPAGTPSVPCIISLSEEAAP
jgi:hypothetical protein